MREGEERVITTEDLKQKLCHRAGIWEKTGIMQQRDSRIGGLSSGKQHRGIQEENICCWESSPETDKDHQDLSKSLRACTPAGIRHQGSDHGML